MWRRAAAVVAVWLHFVVAPAGAQAPATRAASPPPDPRLPTIWVVSDSTASNGPDKGWGSHLGKYFDAAKVNVVNRARAGRSSRSFINEGSWDAVLKDLKAGDFVIIQFSHNDGGAGPAGASLPGNGEDTKEFVRPNGEKETVHTLGWYLRKYVADTRSKGATPVVLSLTVRNLWPDGKIERDMGHFSEIAGQVAKATKADFVDLANFAADAFEAMGKEKTATYYTDRTHTTAAGADLNASLVVAGIKGLKGHTLVSFLSDQGKGVAATTRPAGH